MVFRKLFGALTGNADKDSPSQQQSADPVSYKDVTITPAPLSEGGQYKTAGRISRMADGVEKTTEFIRADNHATREDAITHSIVKAKQLVDERGAALFDSERC